MFGLFEWLPGNSEALQQSLQVTIFLHTFYILTFTVQLINFYFKVTTVYLLTLKASCFWYSTWNRFSVCFNFQCCQPHCLNIFVAYVIQNTQRRKKLLMHNINIQIYSWQAKPSVIHMLLEESSDDTILHRGKQSEDGSEDSEERRLRPKHVSKMKNKSWT